MGKVCVATDIPVAKEFNKIYPESVLVSGVHSKFLENIEKALKIKNDQRVINQCFELANDHDWNKKVDVIENAISKYCEEKNIVLG